MQKFITDVHTHSAFSHDSQTPLEQMLETAYQKGVGFYGVSEHFDFDQVFFLKDQAEAKDFDEEEYFHKARHLQEDYQGCMNVLVGAEFAFTPHAEVCKRYLVAYEKYRPDFVVNSIHAKDGVDYYHMGKAGISVDKRTLYKDYLALIRQSLDAPYYYDIVGHICYATRYTHYEDRRITLAEFGAEIDDILQTIIQKDKILEVNSSNKNGVSPFLPSNEIIKRYFELGGRKVSYASDAHDVSRVCDKREEVVAFLKEVGFAYITVPFRGEHIKVEI